MLEKDILKAKDQQRWLGVWLDSMIYFKYHVKQKAVSVFQAFEAIVTDQPLRPMF